MSNQSFSTENVPVNPVAESIAESIDKATNRRKRTFRTAQGTNRASAKTIKKARSTDCVYVGFAPAQSDSGRDVVVALQVYVEKGNNLQKPDVLAKVGKCRLQKSADGTWIPVISNNGATIVRTSASLTNVHYVTNVLAQKLANGMAIPQGEPFKRFRRDRATGELKTVSEESMYMEKAGKLVYSKTYTYVDKTTNKEETGTTGFFVTTSNLAYAAKCALSVPNPKPIDLLTAYHEAKNRIVRVSTGATLATVNDSFFLVAKPKVNRANITK